MVRRCSWYRGRRRCIQGPSFPSGAIPSARYLRDGRTDDSSPVPEGIRIMNEKKLLRLASCGRIRYPVGFNNGGGKRGKAWQD
jgi:hypothetical protein